jgi:hypothetical protein
MTPVRRPGTSRTNHIKGARSRRGQERSQPSLHTLIQADGPSPADSLWCRVYRPLNKGEPDQRDWPFEHRRCRQDRPRHLSSRYRCHCPLGVGRCLEPSLACSCPGRGDPAARFSTKAGCRRDCRRGRARHVVTDGWHDRAQSPVCLHGVPSRRRAALAEEVEDTFSSIRTLRGTPYGVGTDHREFRGLSER